jgi:hypothetical protein
MQRTKGAGYERLMANRFKGIYPGARRGIGQARSAKEVPDVEGTPYWVEAKHQKCPNLWAALAQADDARDNRKPLVVARRNGGVEVAVMKLEDMLDLLNEVQILKKANAYLAGRREQLEANLLHVEDLHAAHCARACDAATGLTPEKAPEEFKDAMDEELRK